LAVESVSAIVIKEYNMSYDWSLEPNGGDGQSQKGQSWDGDTLPPKKTDDPIIKKAKYQAEVSKFIFEQIINSK